LSPELLTRFQGRSILVIGDVMLDHFVIARVDRISPEAPVPVVAYDHEEYRLGGAANVAHNIVALGGTAQVAGVVGADADAARLASDFEALGIGVYGLVTDPDRCTTRKLRVVTTRNQQVARIDYERDGEVSRSVEQEIISKALRLASGATLTDAARVANRAAGIVVGKFGPATVSLDELRRA
jgi:D-beta-D-heptose 7-phosphate kinase/D-beta-D-heptose 1-phosphate adenosyltransferase